MLLLSRLVSRHPWAVLIVWIVAVLLSIPLAAKAPGALTARATGSVTDTESSRVTALLREKFGEKDTNTALIVTHSHPPLSTPAGQANYAKFVAGLKKVEGVSSVLEAQGNRGTLSLESADGVLGLTLAQIPLEEGATETVRNIRAYASKSRTPELDIRVTGGQAIADDFTEFAEKDTKQSEFTALPLIASLLLLVFGALVATGLPLVVGMLSITVAMAGLYGLTHFMQVSTFAQSVITMLGLGAGIDYALLMVNRFREELGKRGSREAAARTVLTAGRSVAFSGSTVALAMASLTIPDVTFIRSIGIGGVLAVILTILASITALPAILALLGERVNSPRILKIGWAQSSGASATWTAFARRVTSRPLLAVGLSTLFLLFLSLPALNMRTGYAGAWGLAPGVESRDALADVRKLGAGGLLSQFEIVLDLQGQRYGPDDRQQFQTLVNDLKALPGVKAVLSPFLTPADLQSAGASDTDAIAALSTLTRRSFSADRQYLRVTVIPDDALRADKIDLFEVPLKATLDQSGYKYLLGGAPVGEREWSQQIVGVLPNVALFVFSGTFVLLMVAFRSLLIPLKSILMNALTVGAAAGVVTEVVQNGLFAAPLGMPLDVGLIDASMPVLLFAVMFGLSMDYEIFLLSRVQEEYLSGLSNDEAVVLAVGHTARIITSAAIIMFIVFAAFTFGRVIATKSMGLGLAVAVVLDATIVRLILVPAFLKLAGDWNWWLPAWLDRLLPRIRLEH